MLSRRKIKPVNHEGDYSGVETPIPPKLMVKLKKVFLGPKHIREMTPWTFDLPQGTHWHWELWVDAAGKEYASVKHGRNTVWYEVGRLVPEGTSVDTPKESDKEIHALQKSGR
jgi:hypothetical protein